MFCCAGDNGRVGAVHESRNAVQGSVKNILVGDGSAAHCRALTDGPFNGYFLHETPQEEH